jgi:ATP-binding cassette subfamily B protein
MEENRLPVLPDGHKAENANLVFDHVSFGYGGTDALRDISLTIPQKSLTARVGKNSVFPLPALC